MHSNLILHRDLKPDNIFLSDNGKLKIGDFGISRLFNVDMQFTVSLNGTPYYVSPELLLE